LAEIDVMTDDGKMNAAAGVYAGMDRFEARKKIVEDLKALGLLENITEHTNAIGLCERSNTIVEPRASTQWFCTMKSLAEPAIAAVECGEIQIVPDNRRQEYLNWMHNIRDWTLSRQLWWGHRIPAWYCKENKHITVAREIPAKCTTCGSTNLEQDSDVLDTWFSSGLWPFSTLGWPENTADFKTYYPTTLLITGYDILFFWVARMIMLGIHFTGRVPFHAVYLHSLVRTGSGEKMSKTKGTGLDPVALNQQYGTDAMRFCLASMAAPGTDIVLTEDRLASSRNFANKIWNAARFLFVNLEKFEQVGGKIDDVALPEVRDNAPYALGDEIELVNLWIFSRLGKAIVRNNEALANYRFHEAAQSVYHFFWGDFCDWYIEWVKPRLLDGNLARATAAWRNLFAVFERALRLLHPFMPFLTEELWQKLPQRAGIRSIALDSFPEARSNRIDPVAEKKFWLLQRVITSVRTARADNKLDAKKKIAAELSSQDVAVRELVDGNLESLQRLAVLSSLKVTPDHLSGNGYFHSLPEGDIHIPFSEIVNPQAEMARLNKEIEGLQKAIISKEKQLGNESFRSRAPEMIIKGLEATLAQQKIELEKLGKRLEDVNRGSQGTGT
jgi:valyl-tRNA synthetase